MSAWTYSQAGADEYQEVRSFLLVHHVKGPGSPENVGPVFVARDQEGRLRAVAKITPPLSDRIAGAYLINEADRDHLWGLQRLARHGGGPYALSGFLSWVVKELGRIRPDIWYLATYADPTVVDPRPGKRANDGGIYRACNFLFFGFSRAGGVEGYIQRGEASSPPPGG